MASAIQPDGTQVLLTEDGVTTPKHKKPILTPMRRIGAAALTFVASLVAGVVLITANWDTEAEILPWYGDSAHNTRQVIGMFVMALAGMAFIWFLVELRDRVRIAGERRYSMMALTAGTVFVAALGAGAAALAAFSGYLTFSETALAPTSVELIQVLESIGYGTIIVFGGFAAALCMFAASRAAHRARLVPTSIAVVGYGAAVVMLFSLFWFPAVALPVWALIVGIWALTTKTA